MEKTSRSESGRQFSSRHCRRWVPLSVLIPLVTLIGPGVQHVSGQILQSDRIAVTPSLGVAIPLGDMADLIAPGSSASLQVMYQILPRVAVGLEGVFEDHDGQSLFDSPGLPAPYTPPITMGRFGAAGEFSLMPPTTQGWIVQGLAGAGLTYFSSNPYREPRPGLGPEDFVQFTGSYATVSGGLRLGYAVIPNAVLFAESKVYFVSLDEEESIVLTRGDPARSAPGQYMSVPVRLGIRVLF